MQRVVGLPDRHPGRGYPVGAAFFSTGRFYPALVGNDIGCGMALWQTDVLVGKAKLDKIDKIDKQIGNLDDVMNDDDWARLDEGLLWQVAQLSALMQAAGLDTVHLRSLGTVGKGNHFAQLQAIDAVESPEVLATTRLAPKCLQLLVHSGSRGLGQQVLRAHVDAFSHAGLAEGSERIPAAARRCGALCRAEPQFDRSADFSPAAALHSRRRRWTPALARSVMKRRARPVRAGRTSTRPTVRSAPRTSHLA